MVAQYQKNNSLWQTKDLGPKSIANLNTSVDRPFKELLNAHFSFVKLWVFKGSYWNTVHAHTCSTNSVCVPGVGLAKKVTHGLTLPLGMCFLWWQLTRTVLHCSIDWWPPLSLTGALTSVRYSLGSKRRGSRLGYVCTAGVAENHCYIVYFIFCFCFQLLNLQCKVRN